MATSRERRTAVRRLLIVGAGGHAREVHQLVADINATEQQWNVVGFLVEEGCAAAGTLYELPVFTGVAALRQNPDAWVTIAVGSSAARARLVRSLRDEADCEFPTLIHPNALVSQRARVGAGAQIFPGCIVNTDVTIGEHVIVNSHGNISHDSILGDYVTLGPSVTLCGRVRIGAGVELGASVTVTPRCTIGANARVGAGAVVVTDLAPDVTAVGIPARPRVATPAPPAGP
jgi:sugar O-acyltransferase (sialic acid O-acetyltransferase NeuD family)